MKISFKIKLLFYWYKIFRSNHKIDSLIKISKGGKGVKRVAFLLPNDKKEAQLAAHFIKNDDKKNKFHFSYIIYEDSLPLYQRSIISNAFILTNEHMNWLGAINSKNIIDKINNSRFDAIVDLNQSHNQNFSFILMDLTIPIKVGFQDEFSNYLYTITIQSNSIGFLEENYIMIEKMLGLR